MRQEEYEAPVAAFIRSNGVTRRPAALPCRPRRPPGPPIGRHYDASRALRSQAPRQRLLAREPSFWASRVLAAPMSSARSRDRRWELSR
jgi:hypothetical protein